MHFSCNEIHDQSQHVLELVFAGPATDALRWRNFRHPICTSDADTNDVNDNDFTRIYKHDISTNLGGPSHLHPFQHGTRVLDPATNYTLPKTIPALRLVTKF